MRNCWIFSKMSLLQLRFANIFTYSRCLQSNKLFQDYIIHNRSFSNYYNNNVLYKAKDEILPYVPKPVIKYEKSASIFSGLGEGLWNLIISTRGNRKKILMRSCYYSYETIVDVVPVYEFFSEFDMPDTFNSWFLVVELHVWLLSARVMIDCDYGRMIRDILHEAMWSDIQVRLSILKVYGSNKKNALLILNQQFRAAIIGYDEGIQSDDIVLAGIAWRRFFAMECDDAQKIERLVKYIRMQMDYLGGVDLNQIVYERNVQFIPLKDIQLMDKYELLSVVGEGSYGVVVKCRHHETKILVAIKKLFDVEDHYVKRMASREIRILKRLHHENIVNLIEVFKRKRRFYLVFEYLERTMLEDIEENPNGIGEERTKQYMFQVIRAVDYCHFNNVIHRDIKPENMLVSYNGIVKLCDFGFARIVSSTDASCTEYIATRWYRAPELLVRDTKYGKAIDVWALGCVFAELLTGDPLFPGDSDVDQLYLIMKLLGKLSKRQQKLFTKNPVLNKKNCKDIANNHRSPNSSDGILALQKLYPTWPENCLNIVASCLIVDPTGRATTSQLLQHCYFTENNFDRIFSKEITVRIQKGQKILPTNNPDLTTNSSLLTPKSVSHPKYINNTKTKVRRNTGKFRNITSLERQSPSNVFTDVSRCSKINEEIKIDAFPSCLRLNDKKSSSPLIAEQNETEERLPSYSIVLPISISAESRLSGRPSNDKISSTQKNSVKPIQCKTIMNFELYSNNENNHLKENKLISEDSLSGTNNTLQPVSLPNLPAVAKGIRVKLSTPQGKLMYFKQFQ